MFKKVILIILPILIIFSFYYLRDGFSISEIIINNYGDFYNLNENGFIYGFFTPLQPFIYVNSTELTLDIEYIRIIIAILVTYSVFYILTIISNLFVLEWFGDNLRYYFLNFTSGDGELYEYQIKISIVLTHIISIFYTLVWFGISLSLFFNGYEFLSILGFFTPMLINFVWLALTDKYEKSNRYPSATGIIDDYKEIIANYFYKRNLIEKYKKSINYARNRN